MSSSERKISVVAPRGAEQDSGLESRLASLEAEAEQLRAELAALHDDFRWLTEEYGEWSGEPELIAHGWLPRGWVRASLLLVAVGFVALVSVPYLLHQLDPSGRSAEPLPAAASSLATAPATTPVTPAARKTASEEQVPLPVRVRASEIPDPLRVRAEEPGAVVRAPRPRPDASGRHGDPGAGPTPVRDASP